MEDQIIAYIILVAAITAFIYFVKYAYHEFQLKKGIICSRCKRPAVLHGETYNEKHPICPLSMSRVLYDWNERKETKKTWH